MGSATTFGTSGDEVEDIPRDLAQKYGDYYMIGAQNDALFSLNVSDGTISRIGSANFFRYNSE